MIHSNDISVTFYDYACYHLTFYLLAFQENVIVSIVNAMQGVSIKNLSMDMKIILHVAIDILYINKLWRENIDKKNVY